MFRNGNVTHVYFRDISIFLQYIFEHLIMARLFTFLLTRRVLSIHDIETVIEHHRVTWIK